VNLAEEVEIDLSEALLLDAIVSPAPAQLKGFVGADVDPGAGKDFCEFGEPGSDERLRGWIVRGEHCAMRRFAQCGVLLELENLVQMAEGLLLRNDGDVVFCRVGDQFAPLGGCHGSAGKGREGRGGVGKGVFKVGREDVDLVGGEGADLALEKLHAGDGTAGPIVRDAAMGHGGPVADGGNEENGVFAGAADQLLDGLRAVEEAGGGFGDDGETPQTAGHYDVALVLHGGIEA